MGNHQRNTSNVNNSNTCSGSARCSTGNVTPSVHGGRQTDTTSVGVTAAFALQNLAIPRYHVISNAQHYEAPQPQQDFSYLY